MLVDFSKDTILVTGGCGFMGSAFIRQLLSEMPFRGHVINLDLLTYAGCRENVSEVEDDPRYHFVKGDISDRELLEQLYDQYKFKAIVHFAAETHVDRSIQFTKPFIDTNINGTWHLLEFVKEHADIHFHHVSTDEVYGSTDGLAVAEGDAYAPSSPYAASKAASDHLVSSYHRTYGISTTISHASNNYGPYQFPEKLIPLMILNCLEKKKLPLYGSGENSRNWLYVDDHSRAIALVLQRGKAGGVYNVSGRVEMKNIDIVYAIVDEISNILGKDSQEYIDLITHVEDRPGHDLCYRINSHKIEEEIGFCPDVDFQEGIYKTVQWYLHEKDWVRRVKSGSYLEWIRSQYGSSLTLQNA